MMIYADAPCFSSRGQANIIKQLETSMERERLEAQMKSLSAQKISLEANIKPPFKNAQFALKAATLPRMLSLPTA